MRQAGVQPLLRREGRRRHRELLGVSEFASASRPGPLIRPVASGRSDGPTLHGADHNDVADARRGPRPTATSPEEPRPRASAASPALRSDEAAIERRTPPAGPRTRRAGTLAERRRSERRLARRPTIISPHCGEASRIAPRCVRERGRAAAPRSGEPFAAPVPASGKDRSLVCPRGSASAEPLGGRHTSGRCFAL